MLVTCFNCSSEFPISLELSITNGEVQCSCCWNRVDAQTAIDSSLSSALHSSVDIVRDEAWDWLNAVYGRQALKTTQKVFGFLGYEKARELARDSLQNAYLQILEDRNLVTNSPNIQGLLKLLVYRRAIDHLRSTKNNITDEMETLDKIRFKEKCNRDPEQMFVAREQEDGLQSALQTLEKKYRDVVKLRDMEEMSYEEIASTLNIPTGTVKSRLARGRGELKRKLKLKM